MNTATFTVMSFIDVVCDYNSDSTDLMYDDGTSLLECVASVRGSISIHVNEYVGPAGGNPELLIAATDADTLREAMSLITFGKTYSDLDTSEWGERSMIDGHDILPVDSNVIASVEHTII